MAETTLEHFSALCPPPPPPLLKLLRAIGLQPRVGLSLLLLVVLPAIVALRFPGVELILRGEKKRKRQCDGEEALVSGFK